MFQALQLNHKDNVAVVVVDCAAATDLVVRSADGTQDRRVRTTTSIPFGHKAALRPLKMGTDIIKYGAVIGRATADIEVGGIVGVHNIEGLRGRGDLAVQPTSASAECGMEAKK